MTLKVLADMTVGQWAELGISGVVLVAIGVALWLIVKRNSRNSYKNYVFKDVFLYVSQWHTFFK